MTNIYIHIVRLLNGEENIIFSNLPEQYKSDAVSCKKKVEYVKGATDKKYKRQGRINLKDGYVYICTPNKSISNSSFVKMLTEQVNMYDAYVQNYERIKLLQHKDTQRFKHNITTFTSHLSGELYRLITQDVFMTRGYNNLLKLVENIVTDNISQTAITLINSIKYSRQISIEIDAYQYLTGNEPLLIQNHLLHKIITLSVSMYYSVFEEKEVKVYVENSQISINVDYKLFTVVLNNIIDNIQKYILQGSELKFSFDNNNDKTRISISMYSLRIEDSERKKIFLSGYSGIWTEKIHQKGTGMGLYITKLLLQLLGGDININTNHTESIEHNNIPYDYTTIVIDV